MMRVAGLRERNKQATREALRAAALRLALAHGPENVRVDDIAAAAGVSPRTYNNYFLSREHAIVAAVVAERDARVAAAVRARSARARLATAVFDAVVGEYTEPSEEARSALLMITTRPALRAAYVESAGGLEEPLAAAIAERAAGIDPVVAEVLAAAVAGAVRVALRQWVQPAPGGLLVPSGSLPDLLRTTLAPLRPALDAAERRRR